jgi:hypothetical protein
MAIYPVSTGKGLIDALQGEDHPVVSAGMACLYGRSQRTSFVSPYLAMKGTVEVYEPMIAYLPSKGVIFVSVLAKRVDSANLGTKIQAQEHNGIREQGCDVLAGDANYNFAEICIIYRGVPTTYPLLARPT